MSLMQLAKDLEQEETERTEEDRKHDFPFSVLSVSSCSICLLPILRKSSMEKFR